MYRRSQVRPRSRNGAPGNPGERRGTRRPALDPRQAVRTSPSSRRPTRVCCKPPRTAVGYRPGTPRKPPELLTNDHAVGIGGRLTHRRRDIEARGHGPPGWSAARSADQSAPYHVFLVLARVAVEPVDGRSGAGSTRYAL